MLQSPPMEWLIIVLLIINLGFIAFLIARGNGKRVIEENAAAREEERGMVLLLQQQIQDLNRAIEQKLGEGTQRIMMHSDQSQRLMTAITEQVSKQLMEVVRGVSETKESSKQVFGIAERLQNLEKILTHQKQRGTWGELSLQVVLSNILPPGTFKMQYPFANGETVDAVVITKEGIIPIDAKFSLDNYARLTRTEDETERAELEHQFKNDLKLRIDETSKYIRPKDGTLPFAFMYIPAEAIYYDLLINEVGATKVNTRNLIDYAYNEKKVIIVSPTTFAAYLQSVLYGFKAFKIEETAKDIAKNVENLSRHLKAYEDYHKKIGTALSTTVNHYNAGSKELGKIDKDIVRITGSSPELDTGTLDRPTLAGND